MMNGSITALVRKIDQVLFLYVLSMVGVGILVKSLLHAVLGTNLETLIFAMVLAFANILSVLLSTDIYVSLNLPVVFCVLLIRGPDQAMWVYTLGASVFLPTLGVWRTVFNLGQIAFVTYFAGVLIPEHLGEILLWRDLWWMILAGLLGDLVYFFFFVKYACYKKQKSFARVLIDVGMVRLKWIRLLLYVIGIVMAMSYQQQGIVAAIFGFLPVVGVFYLLHTQQELEEKDVLVQRDTLTSVGNRYALTDWWQTKFPVIQEGGGRLSLLMIDLDDFKRINDTFGHQVGDQVLREVSGIIKKSVRERDSIFRYGGEEFIVVLPDSDEGVAWEVAQRICSNIKRVQLRDLGEQAVTVSIGIAGLTDDLMRREDDLSKELIRRSDLAMYIAKRNGKNQVCVYS